MKTLHLLFVVLLLPCLLHAQDFRYDFSVKEVKFSGAGYFSVRHDSTGLVYSTAHWRNDGLREPAAFVSGNAPSVTASFLFNCAAAPDSVTIRGLGSDTFNFAPTTVPLTASSSAYTCTYPVKPASKMFPSGVVNYYAPFEIFWEISFDKGLTWKRADTTDHKVYVTKSTPNIETGNFKYFHTVLELSCKNAKGEKTDTGIISKCWQEFTDQIVLNHKGDSLHYYKTFNTTNTNLPSLLKYRNAQCYTFAQLFASLIKIQGVVRSNNYVFITPAATPTPCGGTVDRFLVKNWKFGTKSASAACPSFPFKNTYTTSYISASGYVFATADVTDQTGVNGVCNKNPSSFFNNHQITKFDGVYYDACYGMKFAKLSDIKTAAFDGWGVQLAPGSFNFTDDLSLADLTETISTF